MKGPVWTFLFGALAVAAGLLFAAGYTIPGAIAIALCAGGYTVRRRASPRRRP